MKRFLTAAICVTLTAFAANAGDKAAKGDKMKATPPADPEKAFKELDANGDGRVNAEEFKKIGTVMALAKANKKTGSLVESMFAKLDTDKSGYLTLEEFKKIGDAGRAKKEKKIVAQGDKKKKSEKKKLKKKNKKKNKN